MKTESLQHISPRLVEVVARLRQEIRDTVDPMTRDRLETITDELAQVAQIAVCAASLTEETT